MYVSHRVSPAKTAGPKSHFSASFPISSLTACLCSRFMGSFRASFRLLRTSMTRPGCEYFRATAFERMSATAGFGSASTAGTVAEPATGESPGSGCAGAGTGVPG